MASPIMVWGPANSGLCLIQESAAGRMVERLRREPVDTRPLRRDEADAIPVATLDEAVYDALDSSDATDALGVRAR